MLYKNCSFGFPSYWHPVYTSSDFYFGKHENFGLKRSLQLTDIKLSGDIISSHCTLYNYNVRVFLNSTDFLGEWSPSYHRIRINESRLHPAQPAAPGLPHLLLVTSLPGSARRSTSRNLQTSFHSREHKPAPSADSSSSGQIEPTTITTCSSRPRLTSVVRAKLEACSVLS